MDVADCYAAREQGECFHGCNACRRVAEFGLLYYSIRNTLASSTVVLGLPDKVADPLGSPRLLGQAILMYSIATPNIVTRDKRSN